MAVYLLDTNVLISLIWPKHRHHQRVHEWFSRLGGNQWATCPMTQCAFVRITSNPAFDLETLKPIEALDILQRSVAHPNHVFWPDDLRLTDSPHLPVSTLRGHQQVTDAYLLALCLQRGGRFATQDTGVPSLARTAFERAAIELLTG